MQGISTDENQKKKKIPRIEEIEWIRLKKG